MDHKAPDAFRTISEVADELDLPQHVLRFWESRFHEIRPMKRGGGRRYYRPDDIDLLRGIKHLLYGEGYTIRGVQRILREQGGKFVEAVWREGAAQPPHGPADADYAESEAVEETPPQEKRGLLSRLIGRDLSDREDDAPVRDEPPMTQDYAPEAEMSAPVEPAFAPEPEPAPAPILQSAPAVHLEDSNQATGLTADEVGRLNAALYELAECRKLLAAAVVRTDKAA